MDLETMPHQNQCHDTAGLTACMYCDRIRDDAGGWTCACSHDLEDRRRISHGVCPTCLDAARMDLLVEVVCELCNLYTDNEPRPLIHALRTPA